ncbi:MAG: YegS/Rv2252/BmrU family lipid kinase [Bacteroidales bacterium]|jgi:diacylglycerol kinase (ATP)|nr:YegS/Rv2252/BmrU family lipid kinase [Bacteroidales bacterium]
MKQALLVVNPFSGNKRGMRVADLIAKKLRSHFDITIYVSNAPGDAAKAIEERITTLDAVFVVGGDGTVNEVLQVVVGTPLALGLFPVGSGNATAYELGNITMQLAIRKIQNDNIKTYDCGNINGRYFMNIVGTGFDTVVANDFAKKETRGLPGYVHLILKHYFNYSPLKITMDDGEHQWRRTVFMINIANMRQLGNFAFTAPMAKPNDGVLDLCIIKPFPKAFTSDLLLRLFSRNLDKSRYYEHSPVKNVVIKGEFSHANVDGEHIQVNGVMNISVVPQSVHIYS